jgi:CheY-like chemotaxis protein
MKRRHLNLERFEPGAFEMLRILPSTPAMKAQLLLVDDDPSIRASLGKVLASEGYQVTFAADAAEAMNLFTTRRFDLLLLDLSLPGQSGWDAFERFTARAPLVPVVIITGRDRQALLAADAGADALLEKPVDVPALLRAIERLLAEPPEQRLTRLLGRGRTFQHVPPDHEQFVELLRRKLNTPYAISSPHVSWGINE